MKEATRYTNTIAQEENDQALEAIRKAGKTTVHVLTAAEKAQWRKAMAPVYKQMESRVGKEALDAITKASAGK
jgi:C4-dicarboxylate-binding protein DctP